MRNSRFFSKVSFQIIFILIAGSLSAQTLTGQQVMDRYYSNPKPATSVLTMSMVITKNGKSLNRTMTTWEMGNNAKGENEKTLIKFFTPADIAGSGFLSVKKADGSTESRLWLPAMGKVRRLSSGPSDQDQPFFGSDFNNRDISGFIESEFTYMLTGSDKDIYTVEATPINSMSYDKLVYQISAKDFTGRKIEYYNDGNLIKTETMDLEIIQGYVMPTNIVMQSESGSTTEINISGQKLDQNLGDQIFTERFLKQ